MQDAKTIKDIKTKQDENSQDILDINEQLLAKVNYIDFTPITTTGTANEYLATISSVLTEVIIVPHVNNLVGATLNGISILDGEGNPIQTDTLKANIPSKLVRVGTSFFIGSGGGGKYDGIVKKLPLATQNNFNMLNDINVIPALIPMGVTNTKDSSIMLIGNNLYYFGGSYNGSYTLTAKNKIDLETGIVTTPSFSLPDYFTNSIGLELQGKAYVFGGTLASAVNKIIYVFDETLNTWTKKYTGTVELSNRGVMYNNNLYIDNGKLEVQIYSIVSNTITTKQLPNYTGSYYSSSLLELNGEIYVFCGRHTNNTFKYNTITGTFSNLTSSSSLSSTNIKCIFKKGVSIYIVTDNNKLLIYDTVLNTWSEKVANSSLFEGENYCKTYDNDATYMFSRNIKGVSLLEV